MPSPEEKSQALPVEKQVEVVEQQLLDPKWITGFVDGEGCFHIGINKTRFPLGVHILPEFTVVQHSRDLQVLKRLEDFFKCGVVRVNHGDRMAFRVRKLEHLEKIIIPFFDQNPLQTKKGSDFLLFRKVVFLMKDKKHYNQEGVEQIKEIANKMNRKGNLTLVRSCGTS